MPIQDLSLRVGVEEALGYFKENKVNQAIVSHEPKGIIIAALKEKNLLDTFSFVFGREDFDNEKPNPAPYLTALEKMKSLTAENVNPKNCLVIEDDPLGVQAAEAAGMTVLYRPLGDTSSIRQLVS